MSLYMNKGTVARTVIVSQSPNNSGNFVCSGAADQVEINAAITYVNAKGGGEVILLEGTYVLAASVLPLSNVTLSGQGVATVLNAGVAAHAIDINNQNYVTIRDLSARTTAGGAAAINAINIQGTSTYITIDSVVIPQSDQDGIAITSADSEVVINQCIISTIDRYGINCDANDCRILENDLTGSGDDGIYLGANSDGCFVADNDIHTWTGEPIDDDGDNTVERNLCCPAGAEVVAWNSKGCGFDDIQEAIDHQAGNGRIDILPGIHTVGGGVVSLDAADNGIELCGAGFLNTVLSSNAAAAIDINACLDVEIKNLSAATTGLGANNAIDIRGASLAIEIGEVAVTDAGQDAISIAAPATNVNIEGCYLFGVGAAGIARHGVNINGADDCRIVNCRISNTGDDGIWLQAGGTFNIVSLNRIDNWVNEAIDNDDPSNTVSHNETEV